MHSFIPHLSVPDYVSWVPSVRLLQVLSNKKITILVHQSTISRIRFETHPLRCMFIVLTAFVLLLLTFFIISKFFPIITRSIRRARQLRLDRARVLGGASTHLSTSLLLAIESFSVEHTWPRHGQETYPPFVARAAVSASSILLTVGLGIPLMVTRLSCTHALYSLCFFFFALPCDNCRLP